MVEIDSRGDGGCWLMLVVGEADIGGWRMCGVEFVLVVVGGSISCDGGDYCQ